MPMGIVSRSEVPPPGGLDNCIRPLTKACGNRARSLSQLRGVQARGAAGPNHPGGDVVESGPFDWDCRHQ